MRWSYLFLSMALAVGCGRDGGSTAPAGNSGPRRITLRISVSGPGAIRAAQLASDCRGDCQLTVDAGTAVHLDPAGDADATFKGWSGACTGAGSCDLVAQQDASVTGVFEKTPKVVRLLEVTVNGAGAVRSDPAGIDCPSRCAATFDDGVLVHLTATSDARDDFAGFGGGCSGPSCTVELRADHKVWATFVQRPVTLAVQIEGNGTVTSSPAGIDCPRSCTAAFAAGKAVVLTPAPAPGYRFAGFRGSCSGDNCSLKLADDVLVLASFTVIPSHQLTVSLSGSGGGRVTSVPAGIDCPGTCTAAFATGTAVALTPAPAAGSRFARFGGACSGDRCSLRLADEAQVSASFDVIPWRQLTVALTGSGGGRVTSTPAGINCPGACSAWFPEDTAVSLSGAPDVISRFASWSGACSGPRCTFGLKADTAALAQFEQRRYRLHDIGEQAGLGFWNIVSAMSPHNLQMVGNWGDGFPKTFLWNGTTRYPAVPGNALAVNDAGVVVGTTWTTGTSPRAYRWEAGVVKDLSRPGELYSAAQGINRDGFIVGAYYSADGHVHATSWNAKGDAFDLGSFGGPYDNSEALGVNSSGIVVGFSTVNDGQWHPVRFRSPGVPDDLGTLGGPFGFARAISDNGFIVGESSLDAAGTVRHGFLFKDGRMSDAGTLPGMRTSTFYSVNSAGVAVGSCFDNGTVRGVVYGGGRMVDLNTIVDRTDWLISYAVTVDEAGNIAADGTRNGVAHVLLLSPE